MYLYSYRTSHKSQYLQRVDQPRRQALGAMLGALLPRAAIPSAAALLAACAGPTASVLPAPSRDTGKSSSSSASAPANVPMSPAAAPGRGAGAPAARRPVVGLALGGGAARGFAHVGVIAALERAGIRPAIVAGTSAGSLVGALYASGMDAARLKRTALELEEGALGDWSFNARGLLRGQALQDMVNRLLAARPIESFPRTFAAAATDLYNGQPVLLRRGDPGRAVRASSAVPGLFQPVEIDGREYVDGGLSSPVPVRLARQLGAAFVIAVDISARPKFQETDTMARVLLQTFAIMGQRIAAVELAEADLVVAPAIGDLSGADFDSRSLAIEEGERAMDRLLPELMRKLVLSSSAPDRIR